jgi:hypothetical protein
MISMTARTFYLIAALVGVLCGVASTQFLFVGSWLNLPAWGATGFIIGACARSKKESARAGGVYGIALTWSFLYSGFRGVASQLPGFALLSLILGVVGVFCGMLASFVGWWARSRFSPRTT